MNSTALQVLLYAFVAAASPLALASTLVVIGGPHRRVSGVAFGIGVVVGQAAACGVAFALGVATVPGEGSARETLRALLELGCGMALLVVAARSGTGRGSRTHRAPASDPRPCSPGSAS